MAAVTTLDKFKDTSNGAGPNGALFADANGDLFGTTAGDGNSNYGTVFEVASTGTGYAGTPATVASFDGANGSDPQAGLIADSNGDLFGATFEGGADGYGTAFEIARTAGGYAATPTALVSFSLADTNGGGPDAGLVADANGDLFGTTDGGAEGSALGTLFEIPRTAAGYSASATTLVTFNASIGSHPEGGLTIDADGDLFGTTYGGGSGGAGTVFELADTATGYAGTLTTLVDFTGVAGGLPDTGLTADAAGDLFGTTSVADGYAEGGTVFEIARSANGYAATATTLVTLSGTYGNPEGALILDAAGDLFGATYEGGTGKDGVVFEIAKTAGGYSGVATTLADFTGANGAEPYLALIAGGNLLGTTLAGGGSGDDGTVFETPACYLRGTRIATPAGDVAIEELVVGDLVLTAAGAARPIRWLGYRSFAGPSPRTSPNVYPVRFRAGCLGRGLPRRDLLVSPEHAMVLDGFLVPARCLINGHSIAGDRSLDQVDYCHIELEQHDVVFAEGAPSETFVDDGNRGVFHNVAEWEALYPRQARVPAVYCAAHVEDGAALEVIRRAIGSRADRLPPAPGEKLRGFVDGWQGTVLHGWAQNPDKPEVPACLEALVDGVLVARTLANVFRPDLRAAGLGSGCHGFRVDFPRDADGDEVAVRRALDRAVLGVVPAVSRRLAA